MNWIGGNLKRVKRHNGMNRKAKERMEIEKNIARRQWERYHAQMSKNKTNASSSSLFSEDISEIDHVSPSNSQNSNFSISRNDSKQSSSKMIKCSKQSVDDQMKAAFGGLDLKFLKPKIFPQHLKQFQNLFCDYNKLTTIDDRSRQLSEELDVDFSDAFDESEHFENNFDGEHIRKTALQKNLDRIGKSSNSWPIENEEEIEDVIQFASPENQSFHEFDENAS